MAATLQQHCSTATNPTRSANSTTATTPNPQLKRLVYSKYRELLGSYNDQANAYIDTLPAYMVQRDNGFNLEATKELLAGGGGGHIGNGNNEMYGSGQRMPSSQTYEAPACVQNAMMTKDKKPFTYTPGGIDLSQIKSERMAKRLARNAQAEGATGQQQHNRPTQPQSPGGSSPGASASMGAAAMGMPFQVLPPPPPPGPGKNMNGGSAPAPPPPPPSSSNFSNTGTLAPPTNGNAAGGRGSAPNSPSMARKSPTPQRFEPPPMGFRPEIKIPPNPMAALRKVPPPVEKNTFWKDEYAKERSKSPMVERPATNNTDNNDSVNSSGSSPQTNASNGTGSTANYGETNQNYNNSDHIDGLKKTMPTTNTTNNNIQQHNQTNNNYTNYQPQQQQQTYTPPTPTQQQQQSPIKPIQQSPQYGGNAPPAPPPQSEQQSSRPEFRSVAAPQSPAVNVYTRQTDSPRALENNTAPRATESPFKFAQQQQQQQQQQQRAPPAVSPLAQQSSPSSASSGASVSPNPQAQSVPWRTQRSQNQQQQQTPQPVASPQSHPQPIYNNVQQQQQQQRSPDFTTQTSAYQGPKPTNVGSLYIAPLAPPTEPQAQHIVRQQLQQQQQQQQRDSPMRQMAPQQQQNQGAPSQQLRWMSSQPMSKEQPAWVRPEENGNVIPSSLNRMKSPPPPAMQQQQQQPMQQHMPQQQPQSMYHPLNPGNGFMPQNSVQNFGAQPITSTGLRLQINPQANQNTQNGPRERIIPIQLEATPTPTYTPAQPSFNNQQQQYGGSISPAPGYVVRTPNQFVDQGYNNFNQQQQQHQQQQRVMSPTLQQLNAPRMVQQTQNNVVGGGVNKTHIIPIAMENNDGIRGPISKTPIVIQNDLRTPPIQSKSFRILQKITDTIDDGSNDDNANQQQRNKQDNYMDAEPQLQRPTFARQMSAQQARNSPTVEQMRRMQIAHEQGNQTPTTPAKFNQQRSVYANNDNSQQYIPPSEQQVPEPKKYTGSAIPSRSFKILQAMTQPENAEEQENLKNNEMNDYESQPETRRHSYPSNRSSTVEPVSSTCSITSLNSDHVFSSSPSPTPPPTQPIGYPPYPYPYGYPWYPPPPPQHMMAGQNGENANPANWPYPYGMPPPPPQAANNTGENAQSSQYPPYPYYYPYYPVPPFAHQQSPGPSGGQISEFDSQNPYSIYMPPPPPYVAYPYPVAPSYSQSSNSSRASSVLPDIIITPSTDEVPSKVILQHHIKKEKEPRPQRSGSIEIEDVSSLKLNRKPEKGAVVDILTQHLENMSQSMENNLNLKRQTKKSYIKNFDQKSPEDNTSPVQITMVMTEYEQDSEDSDSSDSEVTPKQSEKRNKAAPVPLQSIKSVNNLQIYHNHKLREEQDEESDDDETTADGESDVFDEDDDDDDHRGLEDLELEQRIEQDDSECEEFIVEDNLSVIYEEESESDLAKTVIRGDRSSQSGEVSLGKDDDLATKIEDNDDDDHNEGQERDYDTSVTVRLPLKFSFSNDTDNIGTVEVGKSQIEERRNSLVLTEKRNSFSVACVKSDSEDEADYDDCDVSVTISLTSSRSGSIDGKIEHKNMADIYPVEDMPVPEEALEKIESSQEDVSVSFSLNMRNKFANESLFEEPVETIKKEVAKPSEAAEELDFFATLMATKMQAQKVKEQSASYWGKSMEKKDSKEDESKTVGETTDSQESKKTDSEETLKKNLSPSSKNITEVLAQTEDSKEKRTSFWDTYSANETKSQQPKESEETPVFKNSFGSSYSTKTNSETLTKSSTETEEIEDIWASQEDEEKIKKPKFSFWDNSKSTKEKQTIAQEKTNLTKESKVEEDIWSKREEIKTPDAEEAVDIWSKREEVKEPKKSYWNTEEEEEAKTPTAVVTEDIWANQAEEEIKKPKFSFWDNCSKPTTETKSQAKETEEVVDIWAEREEIKEEKKSKFSFSNTSSKERKTETSAIANKETEEVADIWADRVEDLPPIKPIKSKLKTLESAKNSFWSSVAEANKTTTTQHDLEVKKPKPPQKLETITKVEFNTKTLRTLVKELPMPQVAAVHYDEEEEEEVAPETLYNSYQEEEPAEVDFWAHIERVRESKTPEPRQINSESNYMTTFGQQETTFWNDEDNFNEQPQFDPLKYPEEPREVDTDEEIDFWAEIEAKRQSDDEDVTFHKSASFWASRDRKNSIDETPFKPVLRKAFNSRLPDEPATENLNIWAALEAHKGEEPVIIDPEVEEENTLAQEYDQMPEHEQEEEQEECESNLETASVHEPVIAAVWSPPLQQEEPETDFWAEIDNNQKTKVEAMQEVKPERDELEVKRSNYRKAMAFFTTSVDDHKDQSVDRYERSNKSMQRHSYIDETEKWDWEAVTEAIQEENKEDSIKITKEDKELTPKASTPTNTVAVEPEALPEVYVEPTLPMKLLPNGLPDLEVNKFNEQRKISVKDRISAFETNSIDLPSPDSRRNSIKNQSLSVESYTRQSSLSRNSSSQRSESEMDEDDSGVTDMNRQLSETDTESESFPELRKMSSYQRAATHSRLFKLLLDDTENLEESKTEAEINDEFQFKPSRKKIVHNVSITRKQNPKVLSEAETMTQRRERLSLPLRKNTSIDADNPSTPNSPGSPIMGHSTNQSVVSDKLVSELVQSLLLKSDSTHFKKLPMEKLQAAAKRVLEEELDSLDNTSLDSTPAMTPNEINKDKSYADYYNTWSDASGTEEIVPSKSFRALQDTRRTPWTARCPRVLSSKTINRDLSRVTESPEVSMRTSKSPECFRQSRENSVGKWKKV